MFALWGSPRRHPGGAVVAPWPHPHRGIERRQGKSQGAKPSRDSQQTPAFLFESLIDKAHRALSHLDEIVPAVAAGLCTQIELVRHTEGAQFLMQPVVATIPGGVRWIDAEKNMRRKLAWMKVHRRRILP